MMHVLFINGLFENLGIEYLSSALKKDGHRVSLLIDPCLFNDGYTCNRAASELFSYRGEIISSVGRMNPDLVCFSILTDTYPWALHLAGEIKKRYGLPVVMGGIHATLYPEEVIAHKSVDMICVGDGEEAIVELAHRLRRNKSLYGLENIWFKDGGRVVRNPSLRLTKDLDGIDFPDKELFYDRYPFYRREYLIMTSRGCLYDCAYCCSHMLRKKFFKGFVRQRSAAGVIAELKAAKERHHPRFVWFMDDLFANNRLWLEQFSCFYRRQVKLPFFCYLHPNDVNVETINILEEMGCKEIGVGIQTITFRTKQRIRRCESFTRVKEVIKIIRNSKIVCCAENIIGLPQEKEAEILALAGFYNSNRPDLITYSSLKVFPGTDIAQLTEHSLADDKSTGRSLAAGGNVPIDRQTKKAAIFLSLIPFLPRVIVNMILKEKMFCFIPVRLYNPMPRIARFIKSLPLPAPFFKTTYDAGGKVYLRAYVFFLRQKLINLAGGRRDV